MKSEPSFPVELIAQALSIALPEAASGTFTSITTDSRKIAPGCLFVAIPGDRFDGHQFIADAVRLGAKGVLCRKGSLVPAPALALEVPDTIEAYRRIGSAWRHHFLGPVALVAGSVGKTTTKELLTAILHGRWSSVLKTSGSQNGFVGIPMTLLELQPTVHGAAVIEVGIDEIGAMEKHLQLVQASAGLLTPIAPEHLEKLIDLPTVAREESLALREIDSRGGITACNLDDPWLKELIHEKPRGRRIFFSLKGTLAPQGAEVLHGKFLAPHSRLRIEGLGIDSRELTLPLPGEHNALNLLSACALALGLGLSIEEIEAGLKTFSGAVGRSELRKLPSGQTVVCDYYNASPASVEAGLALLETSAQGGRTIACLGDMLELGPKELEFHRALAAPIQKRGIARVLLYGKRMTALREELDQLRATGQFLGSCTHHETHDDLARALKADLRPGDTLLIKGSRGMKMEEVWKRIETHGQPDPSH